MSYLLAVGATIGRVICLILVALWSRPVAATQARGRELHVDDGFACVERSTERIDDTLDLRGTWRVRWDVADEHSRPDEWVDFAPFWVPGTVDRSKAGPGWRHGTGLATFGIVIDGLDLEEDYAIYIPKMWPTRLGCITAEGTRVFAGRNGVLPTSNEPRLASYALALPRTTRVSCTLTFHVPELERGTVAGFWDVPKFGNAIAVMNLVDRERLKFGAFPTFLVTLGLFFAVEWVLRRREREPLLFFTSAMTLGIWVACFGGTFDSTGLVDVIAPRRLEFAGLALAPTVFFGLVRSILRRGPSRAYILLASASVVTAALALVVPRLHLHDVLLASQVVAVIASVGVMWLAARALTDRSTPFDGRLLAVGAACPAVAGVIEILLVRLGRGTPGVTVLGVASLAFISAVVLARRNAAARSAAEAFSDATRRFVPTEFLSALGHADVTTARLGDAKVGRLTVLFADVRNFTTMSERLSPEETFAFLNRLLSRLAPLVRQHGGFVDKYIGDAVMALFPNGPSGAVQAANAMQVEVARSRDLAFGSLKLGLGIGVHVGEVMLGTIGEAERFEATVISDAVNLTARLEGLTKQLGCKVLLTADVVRELSDDELLLTRRLGRFAVKGKNEPIELFESFAADDDGARAQKLGTLEEWESMLASFERGELEGALDVAAAVRDRSPDDGPANWWFMRLIAEMTGEDETLQSERGVIRLNEK